MRPTRPKRNADTLADHVQDALGDLRELLALTVSAYRTRIDSEIASLEERLSGAPLGDLRDLLALMRNLQVKPERGRRKDLKKIDALVGELTLITDRWEVKRTDNEDSPSGARATDQTVPKKPASKARRQTRDSKSSKKPKKG